MDPRESRACARGAQLPVPRVKLFARFITVGFKVDTGKRELVLRFIGLRALENDPEFVLVLSRRSASPLHSLGSDIEEHSSESGRISEVDVDDRRRLSRLKDRRFSVVSGVVGRVVAEGGMNIYSIAPGEPPKIADVLGRVGCTGIGVPVIGLYLSLLKMKRKLNIKKDILHVLKTSGKVFRILLCGKEGGGWLVFLSLFPPSCYSVRH